MKMKEHNYIKDLDMSIITEVIDYGSSKDFLIPKNRFVNGESPRNVMLILISPF